MRFLLAEIRVTQGNSSGAGRTAGASHRPVPQAIPILWYSIAYRSL